MYVEVAFGTIHSSCSLQMIVKKDSVNTIGMEFGTRIIHIADKSIKLQIWDTAGQVICSWGKAFEIQINSILGNN